MIVRASDERDAAADGTRPVRVACVATHGGHAGGAAIAMERLAAGMRACGARVDVVTRDDAVASPAARRLERRIRRAVRRGRRGESNTLFTLDWPAWDVAGHPAVVAADVVNVHWGAGFLNAESVRRLVDRGTRVIWTLHDERGFTGGCHYASGCTGFTSGCRACPQLAPGLAEGPRRALDRAARRLRGRRILFTSPSRWLAGELVRSTMFDPDHHEVEVIPNGIDLTRYAPAGDRAAVRRRLGLPEQGLGILLGSVSLDERRKGGREAAAAVTALLARLRADGIRAASPFVVAYGGGSVPIDPGMVRHLGRLDEPGVIEAIHACDLHLTMTREDNLPNTVMESMACGVPVVATAVGGLPEMIDHGHDGWLVPRDDVAETGAILARLARDPAAIAAAAIRARRRAESQWDGRSIGGRFLERVGCRGAGCLAALAPRTCTPLGLTPAGAATVAGSAWFRGPRRRLRRLGLGRPRRRGPPCR